MYVQAFEDAVNHVMLYEVGGFWNLNAPGVQDGTNKKGCGYGNDPTDAGGETKYGIAKNANPDLDIANLDWNGAMSTYYHRYWEPGNCPNISSVRVTVLHFDGCVNNGVGRAAKFLQQAAGVTADGQIGPATLAAVNAADEIAICNSICDQRAAFYGAIVAARPDQVKYLNGWLRRVNEMRAFVTDPIATFS